MCKAITDMIETAWKEGFVEGFRLGYILGRAEITVESVIILQKNLGLNLQEACAMLGESVEDYEKAKALLQAEELQKKVAVKKVQNELGLSL